MSIQRIYRKLVILGSVSLLVGLSSGATAFAATTTTTATTSSSSTTTGGGNGFRISPVRTDLTIQPGTKQTVDLYVQDVTSVAENLEAVVNDFTASSDESGAPALLLNGQDAPQHGLKQFTTLSMNKFTLQAGQQAHVIATVTIPQDAVAGGYYGAVRFIPAGLDSSKSVNLAASVGSLILVKVPGNIKENMSITGFSVDKNGVGHTLFNSGKSLQAVVRFYNGGDIQEEPFGKVLLKKGSKTLGVYSINNVEPLGNVLPGSIRKFSTNLNGVGSFGKYTVEGNFGYGSNGQLLSATTTFYVIPVAITVLAIVILLAIIFLIFGLPRLIRGYNKRVISKASRRR